MKLGRSKAESGAPRHQADFRCEAPCPTFYHERRIFSASHSYRRHPGVGVRPMSARLPPATKQSCSERESSEACCRRDNRHVPILLRQPITSLRMHKYFLTKSERNLSEAPVHAIAPAIPQPSPSLRPPPHSLFSARGNTNGVDGILLNRDARPSVM